MSYSRPPMGTLSEWLRIMLGEVARKQDDLGRAAAERQLREVAAASGRALPAQGPVKGKVS
ncbi:MAG: hypothetical protein QM696_08370 [Steroidobacteraceae bacterium]